jgi:hypothetical protein
MDVLLVPPSVWGPELAAVVELPGQVQAEHGRLTRAVLWSLQDAHIGITPGLASQAASLLSRSRSTESGVWTQVADDLHEAISESKSVGFTATANPAYFLLKVIKPLLWEASRICGEAHLLCLDEIRSPVTTSRYQEYGRRLERALQDVMPRSGVKPLFRFEHGSVVATFSGLDAMRRVRMPDMDRAVVAVLFGLPENVSDDHWVPRQAPRPTLVPRRRPSPGPQEGRIEGVRHSSREADYHQMVPTEYLAPRYERLDRMANSGFLVYDRRPRRERLRDVLIVGVMPPAVLATRGGAFAKACWADAMARVGRRLASTRLIQTEFRWVEGDALGRVRDCSFFLNRLSRIALAHERHEPFRREFLSALGWLPDFVEQRAGFEPLKSRLPETVAASGPEWLSAALRQQVDRPAEHGENLLRLPWHSERRVTLADRFSFVHVIAFVPATEKDASNKSAFLPGRLRSMFGFGAHPRRSVSVAYIPRLLDAGGWGVRSLSDGYHALVDRPQYAPESLAAALQGWWLERLTREIWHG